MSKLYNENLDKSDVNSSAEASATATVKFLDETAKESETLSLENPKPAENLGEI
ncbi:hypothetical protein A2U01_0105771, partial [Trifolium medium]|nr:hypothetical protein [Trifolium medium]